MAYAFLQSAFLQPAYAEDKQDDGGRDQLDGKGAEANDQRARKRARSIQSFVDQSDSDEEGAERVLCEEEAEDDAIAVGGDLLGVLGPLHPASVCDQGLVPVTPMPVAALRPGSCAITPSFYPLPQHQHHRAAAAEAGNGGPGPAATGGLAGARTCSAAYSPAQVQTSCSYVATCEEANPHFRPYMEDRAAHIAFDSVLYVGCFDGHGGAEASCYLQAHLLRNVQARLQPGADVHAALHGAYLDTNAAFRGTGSCHGSTATTVVVNGGRLIAANVGDSPAFVIMRSGEVFSVTAEHKIEGAELDRVTAAGAPIYRNPAGPTYMGTADGSRWLNMSRAFGDFFYDAISCEPHVCAMDVSDARFLVLGSDGLTEKWPVSHVASYVTQLAKHGHGLQAIAQRVVERAIARGSTDNITAVVVDLQQYHQQAKQQAVARAQASRQGQAEQQQQQQRRGPTGVQLEPCSTDGAAQVQREGSGAAGGDGDADMCSSGPGVPEEDQGPADGSPAAAGALGAAPHSAGDEPGCLAHGRDADSPLSDDTGERCGL